MEKGVHSGTDSFTLIIDRVARAGTKIGTLLSIGSGGNSLMYDDVLIDLGENFEGGSRRRAILICYPCFE